MDAEDRSLQDLFASLRSSSASATAPRAQSFHPQQPLNPATQYRQTSESSPFPAQESQLHAGYGIASQSLPQNSSSPQSSNPDRAASLLNLLKFSQGDTPAISTQIPQSPAAASAHTSLADQQQMGGSMAQNIHGRGVSASDLVASFMGKPQATTARSNTSSTPMVEPTPISTANPQDYLLQLLNRNQSSPAARPVQNLPPSKSSPDQGHADAILDPASADVAAFPNSKQEETKVVTLAAPSSGQPRFESRETTTSEISKIKPLEPKTEQLSQPIFTYVNPFDQLAASSPRNKSLASAPQREISQISHLSSAVESFDTRSQPQGQSAKQQDLQTELTVDASEVLRSVESPNSSYLEDGRTKVEALIGIGAPTMDTETVAQALNNVGDQVSQQVDRALARVEAGDLEQIEKEAERTEQEIDKQPVEAPTDLKKELERPEDQCAIKANLDKNTMDVTKDAIDNVVDGHESADDENSSANFEDDYSVPVYNFPMKPFVSIELTPEEQPQISFRENVITDIARLKKEFNQIDRTLATASSDYIMYAMPKPGGIRVIRQEDGADRQIFKETKDHVFNVAISTAPRGKNQHDLQSCIATAISGTVYWTALYHGGDNIDAVDIEDHCLVFPPVSASDDHTSGGQLKTRAKRSNRHPEFFALGRGKMIQLVFPLHATTSHFVGRRRVIETEAYFKDRSLKINTGKAGKDFTFSEDDTVIATLDKAGRLRFWDVSELVEPSNNDASAIAPVEIRSSLLTFPTSMPNEKSWPTSVLFVDKLKAYTRGVAQRYTIVGLKQNHTLQLWDLGIGKVIQEIHFPHNKESDAICSVCYHPGSSIIVVGHPTRNSIYFIHLSAPRYNLSAMTQASYLHKLVDKQSSLPKPEATAVMSGMREISFASKGQLRSLDLLPMTNESALLKEEPGLFELYVMHSKGVTYLNINKSDLGWSEDNKVVDARDAQKDGRIKMKELVQPPPTAVSESSSVNGDIAPRQAPSINEHIETPVNAIGLESIGKSSQNGLVEKPDKRRKKKIPVTSVLEENIVPPAAPMAPPVAPPSYSSVAPTYASAAAKTPVQASPSSSTNRDIIRAANRRLSPSHSVEVNDIAGVGTQNEAFSGELQKLEITLSDVFSKALGKELESLYDRFQEDKRVLQAQSGAQQEAILRLVSSSLGDNVEKSLRKIVSSAIQESVVPAVHQVTANTLQRELPAILSSGVLKSLPGTVKQALTETVHSAIQKPDVLRTLSNEITSKISTHVEKQFSTLFDSVAVPAFRDLTVNSAVKMASETEQRLKEQLERATLQRDEDASKIDQLSNAVRSLSETIHSMAAAQSEFQKEILKLQQSRSSVANSSPAYAETLVSKPTPEPEMTPAMRELDNIKIVMNEGKLEEGTIMWLQSSDQAGIFEKLFVNINPDFLQRCSPLVTLSVSAAVTATLENNVEERLHWLDTVLSTINARDSEVQDVAPKIMDVLCQRLESRYMEMSEFDNTNPVLRKFPALKRKAKEISGLSKA